MKPDETEENVGTWGLGSVLPTQAGPEVSVGMGKTGAHDPYAKVWPGGNVFEGLHSPHTVSMSKGM